MVLLPLAFPPPLSSHSQDISQSPRMTSLRERITRFYEKHNPDGVAYLDDVMKHYQGREAELLSLLVTKYGPEPPPLSGTPQQPPAAPFVPPHAAIGRAAPQAQPILATTNSAAAAAHSRTNSTSSVVTVLEPSATVAAGAPPPPAAAPAASGGDSGVDWAARCAELMQRYSPKDLPKLPLVLERFRGREETVAVCLERRYLGRSDPDASRRVSGAADDDDDDANASFGSLASSSTGRAGGAAVDGLTGTAPVSSGGSKGAVKGGLSDAFYAVATASIAPDPQSRALLRARMERFYLCYNPQKIRHIDQILALYNGDADSMMRELVARYGPEPPQPVAASFAPSSSSTDRPATLEVVPRPAAVKDRMADTSVSTDVATRQMQQVLPTASTQAAPAPAPSSEKNGMWNASALTMPVAILPQTTAAAPSRPPPQTMERQLEAVDQLVAATRRMEPVAANHVSSSTAAGGVLPSSSHFTGGDKSSSLMSPPLMDRSEPRDDRVGGSYGLLAASNSNNTGDPPSHGGGTSVPPGGAQHEAAASRSWRPRSTDGESQLHAGGGGAGGFSV